MAARYGWLSLLQVFLASQAVLVIHCETLYVFDVDVQANIYATTSGFLRYPTPHNGCMPLEPPPTNSNWFAILDDYHTCTLEKINYTKNAGYQLLFTASEDDSDRKLKDKAKSFDFPIAVPFAHQAEYLKQNASTPTDGPIYVTVQLLINNGKLEIQVLVVDNSSYPINPSPPDSSTIPLIVFVVLLSIFIIFTIAMIGIRCAHHVSHSDSDATDTTSVYGAIEKQNTAINNNNNSNGYTSVQSDTSTKQKASVQLVNIRDSFKTQSAASSAVRHHRGGSGGVVVVSSQKTHQSKPHNHHTNAHTKKPHRQLSLPANPQMYSYTQVDPPSEDSPSDTRTASWVHSHFGISSESLLVRPFDSKEDSCTPACVVCVEKFKEGESVVALPCDVHHIFHWKCITERLARSGQKCPLCTAQI